MSLQLFSHAVDSVFAWICQTTLSATVLIALVVLVQTLFGRVLPPRWGRTLGLLILLRLALPFTPASSWSIFNLGKHFAPPPLATTITPLAPSGVAPASRGSDWASRPIIPAELPTTVPVAASGVGVPPSGGSLQTPSEDGTPNLPPTTLVDQNPRRPFMSFHFLAETTWLTGCLVMLAIIFRRHRKFTAALRSWEPVREPRVLELLESCQEMLGVKRRVSILAAHGLNTPALFGVLRPRLLLPAEMLRELSDRELRHIFLHELVHLRRGDVLINWAMIGLRALHWFNPAVWFAFRRLRADQELACDAAVLARLAAPEQLQYGNTLVKLLADFSSAGICPGAVPFITHKQIIRRRVKMIASYKPAGRLALAVSLTLVAALMFVTFTRAADTATGTAQTPAPLSRNAEDPDAQPSVMTETVAVDAQGRCYHGSDAKLVTRKELQQALRDDVARGGPQLNLIIHADQKAPYGDVRSVLDFAQQLGITRVQLNTSPVRAGFANGQVFAENDATGTRATADRMVLDNGAGNGGAESHPGVVVLTLGRDGTVGYGAEAKVVSRDELKLILLKAVAIDPATRLLIWPAENSQSLVVPDWIFSLAHEAKIHNLEIIRAPEAGSATSNRTRPDASADAELKRQLAALDSQIAGLKQQVQGSDYTAVQNYPQTPQRIQASIAEANQRILEKQALLGQLQALSAEDLRQVLPTTVPDPLLTDALRELAAAQSKLTELKRSRVPSNPEVVTMKSLVDQADASVNVRVKGILSGIKLQIDTDHDLTEKLQAQNSNNAEKTKYDEFINLKAELDKLEQSRDDLLLKLRRSTDARQNEYLQARDALMQAKMQYPEGSPMLDAPRQQFAEIAKSLFAPDQTPAASQTELRQNTDALARDDAEYSAELDALLKGVPEAQDSANSEAPSTARDFQTLLKEIAKLDEQIRSAETNMDAVSKKLSPTDQTIMQVRSEILQQKAKTVETETTLNNLMYLSTADLRAALPTVYPDTILPGLLEDLKAAKLKLTTLTSRLSPDNPEVRAVNRVIADRNDQIDSRVTAILTALRVQIETSHAQIQDLESSVKESESKDPKLAERMAPYYQANDNLKQLKKVREVLLFRIGQEATNVAPPPK